MKLELTPSEVIEAVSDYLKKRNVPIVDLSLRTVRRDGEDAIVAEGAVEVVVVEEGRAAPGPHDTTRPGRTVAA